MAIQAINTQSVLTGTIDRLRNEASILPASDASADRVNFTQIMHSGIKAIDNQQHAAGKATAAVEMGESDDLVGAMVASQKAGLSFSALVQVRNRLVSGFDEIMRMPV